MRRVPETAVANRASPPPLQRRAHAIPIRLRIRLALCPGDLQTYNWRRASATARAFLSFWKRFAVSRRIPRSELVAFDSTVVLSPPPCSRSICCSLLAVSSVEWVQGWRRDENRTGEENPGNQMAGVSPAATRTGLANRGSVSIASRLMSLTRISPT